MVTPEKVLSVQVLGLCATSSAIIAAAHSQDYLDQHLSLAPFREAGGTLSCDILHFIQGSYSLLRLLMNLHVLGLALCAEVLWILKRNNVMNPRGTTEREAYTTENHFLLVREAGSPRSGVSQVGPRPGPVLGCGWASAHCVFTGSSLCSSGS